MITENLRMIVATLIDLSSKDAEKAGNLRINKLLYFIQAYNLVANGRPAFEDKIEAWMYGPVAPEFYHIFKNTPEFFNVDTSGLEPELLESTKLIYEHFKDTSVEVLVNITHSYEPWIDAWNKGMRSFEIKKDAISSFHKEKLTISGGLF